MNCPEITTLLFKFFQLEKSSEIFFFKFFHLEKSSEIFLLSGNSVSHVADRPLSPFSHIWPHTEHTGA
jgi:hypothetical protein